jgi:hypothetical protein
MEDDTLPQHGATTRKDGDALAEQLNQTTSENAGGTVSGTGDRAASSVPGGELDVVFDAEEDEHGGH